MKPISLRMEAFGPYGAKASIDFEPLADVGLFVVSGPTGAGKSTIFDAMCFALYGSLSGARQGHIDVRSHYADPSVDCEVELVFDANGERWRVTRQPAQTRQKRRGAGTTERPADAVLERWIDGQWHPEAAKVRDVTARCRELVGLSLDQFERVVLLPQGKFADVLNARTSDRAELLRTLFGSEVFERVGDVLAEDARTGEQALRGAAEHRDRFHRRAVDALDRAEADLGRLSPEIAARLEAAAVQRRRVAAMTAVGMATESSDDPDPSDGGARDVSQLSLLDPSPIADDAAQAEDSSSHEPSQDEIELDDDPVRRSELLRTGPLVDLESVVASLQLAAGAARSDLERAEAQVKAIEQRRAAAQELGRLEEQRTAMESLAGRLKAARRVVGLSSAVARREQLARTQAERRDAIDDQWDRVRSLVEAVALPGVASIGAAPSPELLSALVEQTVARITTVVALMAEADDLRRRRSEHTSVLRRLEDLETEIGCRGAELDQLAVERTSLEEQARSLEPVVAEQASLIVQHETMTSRVAVRRRADETIERVELLERRLVEQTAAATASRSAIDGAAEEVKLLDDQIGRRREVESAVESAERRLARRLEIERLTGMLSGLDAEVSMLQERADNVFAAFVRGAAPRLAAELTEGSSCPVCGSCEHPAPAEATEAEHVGGMAVDVSTVEAASASAADARARCGEHRALVTALVAEEPALVEMDHHQLAAELADERAVLADIVAADVARAEIVDATAVLERRLSATLEAAAAIESERANANEQLANLLGELGSARNQTLDELDAQLSELRSRLDTVEAAAHRRTLINDRLVAMAAEQSVVEHAREALRIEQATSNQRIEQLATSIREAELQRDEAADGADLGELRRQLTDLRQRLLLLQQLSTELAASEASFEAAASACFQLVADAGFESEGAAVAASMPDAELERGATTHADWVHRRTTLIATVDALDAQGLPDQGPDIDALRAAAIGSETDQRLASDAYAAILQHSQQASADLDEVASIDRTTAEQRAHHDVVRRVAAVVRGKNSRRLSLENWVLSVYLHDVVEHANLHLHTMSNGRYRLLVQDTPSNQIGQHGLDLVIDDAHTGRVRPSVSLSGGETFQASLALALGLADVVMVGRAGLHLDALFVDEGFGSLDADAVDQAITVLDGLRSRGSMVGVITHVEALKSALPVAIEVLPRPDHRGSEIRQVA